MTLIETPSPNFDDRPNGQAIDMLVLHYTGMRSMAEAMDRLRDPSAKVSAHYVIDENGDVHRLVQEEKRAWHAGVSSWRGETNVNARSIGIELVNPGHEFGYRAFPKAQIEALIPLAQGVLERHPIPARNVVGHSDIAPSRKQDPGELFDWKELALHGIGLWPKAFQQGQADGLLSGLARFGYDVSNGAAAVAAFQHRFRPHRIDGKADPECAGILDALLALVQE